MSALPRENIFDSWNTYAKVVAANHMFHREIGEAVNRALRSRFASRTFSLLDLGCGDAATLGRALEGSALSQYKGVDLSQTALALAHENLKALGCPVELVNAHLLDGFSERAAYDAIYTSFALHHLPTEQKAGFFRLAAQSLAQGGLLLLVDVVRDENQPLDVYHRRYCEWLRESWTALEPAERESVCDHIVNNDLPDPFSVLEAQAKAAGLAVIAGGVQHNWHRLLCFERS
jgi:cyclopropane fatty-acyl-phospholipid synthase-like methyltransferase